MVSPIDIRRPPSIPSSSASPSTQVPKTVVLSRVEQETPPARRVEADIDVLVGADCEAEGAGEKGRARQEIEEAADTQADQEELNRIADGTFVDVQLGDVVVRRVGQP